MNRFDTEGDQMARRDFSITKRAAAAACCVAALAVLGPATVAHAESRSCGWEAQPTGDQVNVAYPDEFAKYWLAVLPIPVGGAIEVDGQYPHARYTSLTTYNATTAATDGLNDQQIMPDAGSSNPMLAGADRTATKRNYTAHVVAGQAPAGGRAPNTLYTTSADGSKTSGNLAVLIVRIYATDRGTGLTGGVPLPALSLVTSTGSKTTLPDCPLDVVPDTGYRTIAATGSNVGLPKLGAFGRDPLRWHRYVNAATAVADGVTDNEATGTTVNPALTGVTASALPKGGFFENIDNKYVYSFMDRSFGQVLVLHAKAPTTPRTLNGNRTMRTGQLRYWSMCTYELETTGVYACTHDQLVPLDRRGYYTIAISTAAARPANATTACGIAWLPAGPAPQTTLVLRNMLPRPAFAQAIQNVEPGHEQQTMGAYYPAGTYYATAQSFERTGCHRPTNNKG